MSSPFISIEISPIQLKALQDDFGPEKAAKAALSAINKTLANGMTQFKRRISSTLNITYKEAGRSFAATKATRDTMEARIRATNKLIPLAAIKGVRDTTKIKRVKWTGNEKDKLKKGRWGATGHGVFAQIFGQGPTQIFKHAFKLTVASSIQKRQGVSHTGIFSRARHLPSKGRNAGKGSLTSRGIAGRFALQEHFIPSVIKLLGEAGTTQMATEEFAKLQTALQKNLASQFDRFLAGQPADPAPEPDA